MPIAFKRTPGRTDGNTVAAALDAEATLLPDLFKRKRHNLGCTGVGNSAPIFAWDRREYVWALFRRFRGQELSVTIDRSAPDNGASRDRYRNAQGKRQPG